MLIGCDIHQAINLFVNSADELFGPMTTVCKDGCVVKNIPWSAFNFKPSDWEQVNDTCLVIMDANKLQQAFSSNQCATLWKAIPAFEELQSTWESKSMQPRFTLYQCVIKRGLAKLREYYRKFDNKPVFVLALGLSSYCHCHAGIHGVFTILSASSLLQA